jgi:hypothetical protein
LNHVFSQMGLSYMEHTTCPKRRRKTLTRDPAQSQTSIETPSTCLVGVGTRECSEVFAVDQAETCDPVGSAHDVVVKTTEDSANLVTEDKLGKDLIPMRVGTGVGCSQLLRIENKATQILNVNDIRPSKHYLLSKIMILGRR